MSKDSKELVLINTIKDFSLIKKESTDRRIERASKIDKEGNKIESHNSFIRIVVESKALLKEG